MRFDLKPLSAEAIARALTKAERYRLLNEPGEAESICLDVLGIEPENQDALIVLLLALTDQFDDDMRSAVNDARDVLRQLHGNYERAYYGGIICERRAKAHLHRATPGSGPMAYQCFLEAMDLYEQAEALRPPGNDDAVLRWNTCARLLMRHPHLEPRPHEPAEPLMLE